MSLEATIKISPEARDALKELGRKGESYDAVIRRLIIEKEIAETYIYRPDDWDKYQKELEAEG